MRMNLILLISVVLWFMTGCSGVKLPVANEYQIRAFSVKRITATPLQRTLLVSAPEASAGYDTEAMLYIKKPFQLETFAKNAWASPPADMLFPLLVESLQKSGYFNAVTASIYTHDADYRLDTRLLTLEQNFLKKPSILQLSVKVVLTRISDNVLMGSQIISKQVPCPADTPYGGVLAANRASEQLTADIVHFVVSSIKHD